MKMDTEALISCAIDSYSMDSLERIGVHALIRARAEQLSIGNIVSKMLSQYDAVEKGYDDEMKRSTAIRRSEISLARGKSGDPLPTIENFFKVMVNDPKYDGVRYNLLSNRAEVEEDGKIRLWSDADAAESREYIESKYNIHHEGKHRDALRLLFREREFHPVRNIVNALVWDGTPRIEEFLVKWMKADDNEYTREVSRLIFAGGINRLYNPGCKFDDVPVLIGTSQGEGKSSIIRWLAINDSYYSEVTEIEGQKSIEQLEGAWVCEVAELMALTKAKEQEAVKAYVTRQRDKYRKPYSENVEVFPRNCVFVGTTNRENFLLDKTGNRRWYPVKVYSNGYWLFDHEHEVREYIIQCWAEARDRYFKGEMPSYADPKLLSLYREAQNNAMEDDWRLGAIQAYLDEKRVGERVCIRQIAHEALSTTPDNPRDPTKIESNEIAQMMSKMEGWSRIANPTRHGKWGKQRCWEKSELSETESSDLPFN